MNMHKYISEGEVSLLYKKAENRKKKFLDEVTTALNYGYIGGWGVCFEKIGQIMLVYTI